MRHLLPDGRATDAVGALTARTSDAVTVHSRRGEVSIALDAVVAAKAVPPPPPRKPHPRPYPH